MRAAIMENVEHTICAAVIVTGWEVIVHKVSLSHCRGINFISDCFQEYVNSVRVILTRQKEIWMHPKDISAVQALKWSKTVNYILMGPANNILSSLIQMELYKTTLHMSMLSVRTKVFVIEPQPHVFALMATAAVPVLG
jgi:hypothetical protein